jgi:hypothetical protein
LKRNIGIIPRLLADSILADNMINKKQEKQNKNNYLKYRIRPDMHPSKSKLGKNKYKNYPRKNYLINGFQITQILAD